MKCSLAFLHSSTVRCSPFADSRLCSHSPNVENTDIMYRRILQDPLRFPDEIGGEARSILSGLLTRDASQRLGVRGAESIKSHPFFSRHIDWLLLMQKKIKPPFKPSVVRPRFLFDGLKKRYPYVFCCCRQAPSTQAISTRSSHPRFLLTALWKTITYLRPYSSNLLGSPTTVAITALVRMGPKASRHRAVLLVKLGEPRPRAAINRFIFSLSWASEGTGLRYLCLCFVDRGLKGHHQFMCCESYSLLFFSFVSFPFFLTLSR